MKWYHCERGVTLTKASLGRFFYYAGKMRAEIGQVWYFAPQYERSSVIISIKIDAAKKEEFESLVGCELRDPPVVHLN